MRPIKLLAVFCLALTACADAPKPAAPVEPAPKPASVEAEPATLPELLREIESAYRKGNNDRGLALVRKVFELKQKDVSMFDRIGSVYYVLGRYGEALTMWQNALPLEHDPKKREALMNSIAVTRRTLGLPEPPAVVSAAKPKPRRPARKPAVKAPPKDEIERLYKAGVKFYTAGEYLQATTAFLKMLELDPENADAKKALERLRAAP